MPRLLGPLFDGYESTSSSVLGVDALVSLGLELEFAGLDRVN